MAEWEPKNKIAYSPNGDTIDSFSQKVRDEFVVIYHLLNRLRTFGALSNNISDTLPYQFHIDKATGRLFIRNSTNTDWIELGSINESFFGITADDIGAAKKLVGLKSDMPAAADTYDIYWATDEKRGYFFSGTSWEVFLSLNFEDFSNYADYVVTLDEVGYNGKDKVLRLDKNTGKGNIDITGSAGKIFGYPIEIKNLENDDVLAFDGSLKKFVNKPKDETTSSNISTTGEANKIVQTDDKGIANISISGSAEAINGVPVNLSGATDGQVLIYSVSAKSVVPSDEFDGNAKTINGIGVNVSDLENGKPVAYDSKNKMLVSDKNNYLTEDDASYGGDEVGKVIRLGTDRVIKANITGSAEKIDGVEVDTTGIKDGQVLAYDFPSKTLKPVNKDYFSEKSVSETGEVGKLIRLGSDKTIHANLDGSVSKVDGVEFDLSGIKSNQVLTYESADKTIVPKEIDTSKINGMSVDTSNIQNGQVLVYFSKGNKLIPSDKDYVTEDNISTTGEKGKLIRLGTDGIVHADIEGNAETSNKEKTADKLSSARNFSIGGKVKASAVEFDGSSNVILNVTSVEVDAPESVKKLETPGKITVDEDAEGVIYWKEKFL